MRLTWHIYNKRQDMPRLMSLGEAKVYAKTHFDNNRGLEDNAPLPPHKKRMNYQESCEYYNKKLFSYWVTQISDEIPTHKRESVLKYLLGERDGKTTKKTDKRESSQTDSKTKALYLATKGRLSKTLRPTKNKNVKISYRHTQNLHR